MVEECLYIMMVWFRHYEAGSITVICYRRTLYLLIFVILLLDCKELYQKCGKLNENCIKTCIRICHPSLTSVLKRALFINKCCGSNAK